MGWLLEAAPWCVCLLALPGSLSIGCCLGYSMEDSSFQLWAAFLPKIFNLGCGEEEENMPEQALGVLSIDL